MTSLVGHAAAEAAFARALAGGTVHHAWLLTGPEGVGKAHFARRAAIRLLAEGAEPGALGATLEVPTEWPAARLMGAGSHPDFRLLERALRDPDKSDVERVRSITVDQVRSLGPMFATRPSMGATRAVVIDAADDLAREGANALLKSLEEPPTGTVFFLVSHAPGRLLPTIRSRCRVLRFSALTDAEMRAALADVDPGEVDGLIAAGEGSPGRALRFAGLDVAAIDKALAAIAETGDPQVAERSALGRALAGKSAQPRYEAFLERAPAFLAARARGLSGPALAKALDAQAAARELAGAARGLSLDAQGTVWEMAGLVATLAETPRQG